MVIYRFVWLNESALFESVTQMDKALTTEPAWKAGLTKHLTSYYYFWPRQLVASVAWIANDFAFYGNKLQQGVVSGAQ